MSEGLKLRPVPSGDVPRSRSTTGRARPGDSSSRSKSTPFRFSTASLLEILAGSAFLAAVSFFFVGAPEKNETPLPETYALCSRGGPKIYTVDDNNSKAECLVIQGSIIIDVGRKGESVENLGTFIANPDVSCQMRC